MMAPMNVSLIFSPFGGRSAAPDRCETVALVEHWQQRVRPETVN
jgi:hypothetical protein